MNKYALVQKRHVQYTMRSISTIRRKDLAKVDTPEVVKAMALVIQTAARPALSGNAEIENNIVIKTAKAPKASKLSRSHLSVIQNVYHICGSKMRHTHLGRDVNFAVHVVEEAFLGGEGPNRGYTFQKFAEI
jgi:myo-inositol-hexaphosphate 3-phosphohydrolase